MRDEIQYTLLQAQRTLLDCAQRLERHGDVLVSTTARQTAEGLGVILSGRFPCCEYAGAAQQINDARQALQALDAALTLGQPDSPFVPPTLDDYAQAQNGHHADAAESLIA